MDLYSGSGAVGIEAISRGAASVAFVERAPAALKVLRANLAHLGITSGFTIQSGSVAAFLRRAAQRFDIAFLDPPYDEAQDYAATLSLLGVAANGILASDAVVIAEHRRKLHLEQAYGTLARSRLLEQGDAALSFYKAGEANPTPPHPDLAG